MQSVSITDNEIEGREVISNDEVLGSKVLDYCLIVTRVASSTRTDDDTPYIPLLVHLYVASRHWLLAKKHYFKATCFVVHDNCVKYIITHLGKNIKGMVVGKAFWDALV